MEHRESQVQDPLLLLVLQTTATLRQQTTALLDLIDHEKKDENNLSAQSSDVLKAQRDAASQLSILRRQNHRVAHLVRDTKAATGDSRAEVDRLHLSLQNLYYEQRHLAGEIAGCEHYPHPYLKLPLISEEDFLEKYPEWEARRYDDSEGNGVDGLMRARIEDEKKGREALEAQRQELLKRRTELIKENTKRKTDLGNLDKDLEAFIEAAKPIQKTFQKEYE